MRQLLIAGLLCLLVALPVAAQDSEATAEATSEATVEATPEATVEATAETTPEIPAIVTPEPTEAADPSAITCRKGDDAFTFHIEAGARARGRELNIESYQHYNCAVQLDPNSWIAYRGRGIGYYAQNNLQSALADINVAVDMAPKEPTVHYWRALILFQMGEEEAALQNLDRTIELDPGYPQAFNLRGIIHRETNQLEEAKQDFQIAITMGMPDSPHIPYMNMGNLYLDKLDNRQEAVYWYEQAARVTPGNAAIYEVLGDNYLELGNVDEAERNYRLYVDIENNAKDSVLTVVEGARLRQMALRYAPSIVIFLIVVYFVLLAIWQAFQRRYGKPAAAVAETQPAQYTVLTATTPIPGEPLTPAPQTATGATPITRSRSIAALVFVPLLTGAVYLLRWLAQPSADE